jgi:uncharacterized protein (TIGR02757 family)
MKDFLEEVVARVNRRDFVESDPVQFPRRYDSLPDIEIAGLLVALISWGKREMILRSAERMLALMGPSPYEWVMNEGYEDLDEGLAVHRTFNTTDLKFIARGLRAAYSAHASLEELFAGGDMFDGIARLRTVIIDANKQHAAQGGPEASFTERSMKHLANPDKGSVCKRLHMFLKWMVRRDGIVDLGLWRRISPAQLYIPLDVHVGNTARRLGLLSRSQDDRRAVEELTARLRELSPDDPVRYDFALFGIGIYQLL